MECKCKCADCKQTGINLLTEQIEQWAIDRGLGDADPFKQMLKLGEEYGELCAAMARNQPVATMDAIGDIYVVLTILSMQIGIDIEKCVADSYEEIKDRNGKMVNGVFVKAADL
jgi:NTP pyrophosphatase (non-canonical NTP hydrolase)